MRQRRQREWRQWLAKVANEAAEFWATLGEHAPGSVCWARYRQCQAKITCATQVHMVLWYNANETWEEAKLECAA